MTAEVAAEIAGEIAATPTMDTVGFTQMKDGTKADYDLLGRLEAQFVAGTADRVLDHLGRLASSIGGYKVSRLEHSLQSATRAERDGADADWIVTALLHDIGDDLAPHNHSKLAAAVLEPFVRDECHWVLRNHGAFQLVYYGHHIGEDPNARDRFRDSPYFDQAVKFCERWDQRSFDPSYDSQPLQHFVPMVRTVFGRKAFDPAVLRPGETVPIPG